MISKVTKYTHVKKKIFLITACLIVLVKVSYGQQAQRISETVIQTDAMRVTLQFYSPSIVRVIKTKQSDLHEPAVNFSIVALPKKVMVKKTAEASQLVFHTDSLTVKVNKVNASVSFLRKQKVLLKEDALVQPQFGPLTNKQDTYRIKQGFVLEPDEAIYGLGQHQEGTMNQRNHVQPIYQNNMEIAMPVLQSIKGYGILWNNESPTLFADTLSQTYFLSDKGQAVDYFFIWGGHSDAVVAGIRELSGRSPLLPKWAFGFAQSRERYKSQEEVVDVIKEYRKRGVPLDCIVQDWQYWGTDFKDWNALRFDNPAYNKTGEMIKKVHDLNAKIIISVWPSFGPNTAIYKALDSAGFLYKDRAPDFPKGGRVYNAFNKDAQQLVWDHMNRNIFSKGMDGWWLDATEPFEKYDLNVSPKATFKQLDPLFKNTGDTVFAVANSYPLYTVGAVVDRQRKETAARRPFVLTRSGYIGQQRYGSIVWSGDIISSWEVMKNQISGALNLGLSGMPYWNADIGGFYSAPNFPQGHTDPAFRELVVRWIQFGAFTALMRLHGTNTPREIYQYGEKGQWTYDAIEKFINLRYRLLPYTYSTSYQVMTAHASLMRPLFADYKDDKLTHNINDQFLYEQSFLIAPVVTSQYVKTATKPHLEDFSKTGSRNVYLPKGNNWIDFWNGKKLPDGQLTQKQTPIDMMPIYVKAGAIVPLGDFKQYSGEKKDANIEIRIYPGANGQFVLYEDEGDNYNYEKGKFSTIDFKWDDKNRKLLIGTIKGSYDGMLKKRLFHIVLVGEDRGTGINPSRKINRTVEYSGKAAQIAL